MEEPLIEQTLEFGVDPMLVLTPFAETGSFNNQLVKAVSEDLQMQQVLIENLVQTVQEKQYAGVVWILNTSFRRTGRDMPHS